MIDRKKKHPLQVTKWSGYCDGLNEHPVRRLYDAGVPITLNTDDPAMFRCTLNGEYRLAMERFGFTEEELRGIAENAFRYGFISNPAFIS